MQFEPKTESQIIQEQEERAKASVWPTGIYSYEVIQNTTFGTTNIATEDTQSQKGNDMIRLVINIYNDHGECRAIIDHLMALMPGKLRSACVACGLLNKYETGQLFANDFIGKKGDLRLGIVTKGQYAGKNEVLGYIENISLKQAHSANDDFVLDDEITF